MKNKKIGILTYHTGYNYGASLQAYALQQTIKRYCNNCKIINFETVRFLASREMFSRNPKRLKEFIKIFSRLPYYKSLKKRQRMFDAFTNNCLDVTELYRTEQEVIDNANKYDCIVVGSDQVWNLSDNDAPAANKIFYLNFPKKQRRVTYSVSFGKWVKEIPKYEKELLPLIKQFDKISVREKSGVEYLKSRGIDTELTLDPTILLDKEDYDKICTERLIKEKYVLMFGWNTNKDLITVAKQIAKFLNVKLINIVPPPRAVGSFIKRKLDIGPREFLSMIKYAEFVVTNSFHGTAFSTIYEKDFVSVVTNKPDPRMQSLLEQLDLDSRLLKVQDVNVSNLINTDYSKVQQKRKALRKSSIDYLKNAIEVNND